MDDTMKMAIGFVTGRPNVCKVINNMYDHMLEQLRDLNPNIKLTIFILFDLSYQKTTRVDFYSVLPQVYKNIKIRYITPEDIEEEKKKLIGRYGFTKKEVNFILGHGHAKGRNTLLYYAAKSKYDYLLFWDDDEYPVACMKNEDNTITWKKQNNISKHLEYIKDSDITIGYHCGYISPIPYIEINKDINEDMFKKYIEAISNDIISWDAIKENFKKNNGVTYANPEIADGKGVYEIQKNGAGKWIAGSTLCLNLKHLDKIPAFYNPPGARGEDTFFSTLLDNSKVLRVPLYHFHDGFLKYQGIMKQKYPSTLRKIKGDESEIGTRFLKASKGWMKYKPLLLYISDKKNYKAKIAETYQKLQDSVPEINKLFPDNNFNLLLDEFKEYSENVDKHYKEYLKTNEVWNKIKENLNN